MESIYPDTSFLFSLHVLQKNTPEAVAFFQRLERPLYVSPLAKYELFAAIRQQVYRFNQDEKTGFPEHVAQKGMALFQRHQIRGLIRLQAFDFLDVIQVAERLSATHVSKDGYNAGEMLHVATSLYLGCSRFLSFDKKQRALAEKEGLITAF